MQDFTERFKKINPQIRKEVNRSLDILERINYLLDMKFGGKQKLLADKMGKTEAEISKMINGNLNFTLKTIAKLESAFGEEILAVVCNKEQKNTKAVYANRAV
ncbi:MAG: helix-turn-helix domain-containing protein [Chitinophagaceae bacterium]|jgi:transcriptional regulator with XRE-family HTH domain|nr:helix-turn-helix domain-containing protein [Chitinophagaceae bacterium]